MARWTPETSTRGRMDSLDTLRDDAVQVWTDGCSRMRHGACRGPSGSAAVLFVGDARIQASCSLGVITPLEAELAAAVMGLAMAGVVQATVDLVTDSLD